MTNPEPAVRRSRRSNQRPGDHRRRPWLTPRKKIAVVVIWILGLIAAAALTAGLGRPPAIAARPAGARFRTTQASVGSITRVVVLDGVVVREQDQHVLAPALGTVRTVDVALGGDVVAGQTVATIELPLPPPPAPIPTPSPSPTPSASPSPTPSPTPSPSPTPVTMNVVAPMDGVVSEVAVVEEQQVAVGQAVVSISPNSFDVIAPVRQSLLNQFLEAPLGIQATVSEGPSPFDCEFLSIGANLGTSGAQQVLTEDPDLRCHVPDEVVVVAGIHARLSVTTGEVQDVVVVPVSAVQTVDGQSYVWVVEGHTLTQTTVTLGISDGKLVEITDGLSGGQTVLDPVRGQAPEVSPTPSPSGTSPSPTAGVGPTPTGSPGDATPTPTDLFLPTPGPSVSGVT